MMATRAARVCFKVFGCLLLMVALLAATGAGRARAATQAQTDSGPGGSVATLTAPPANSVPDMSSAEGAYADEGIAELEATLVEREASIKEQMDGLDAEYEALTKRSSSIESRSQALNSKSSALEQKASQVKAAEDALSTRIDEHNANKPSSNDAAAVAAYNAEAAELNSEKDSINAQVDAGKSETAQLENEQSQLDSDQEALQSAADAYNAAVDAVNSQQQELQDQARDLVEKEAQAQEQLAASPPEPTETMDDGGDAVSPAGDEEQAASQGVGDTGGDSPSLRPQISALRSYGQQTGTDVVTQPGIATLSPGAVSSLPAPEAAALGSPVVTYDGLAPEPNGHYEALEVQSPDATSTSPKTSPKQKASTDALTHGQATATVGGKPVVIDRVRTIPGSRAPAPSPSPQPDRKATCLTSGGGEPVGGNGSWIRYSSQYVKRKNKVAAPTGPGGQRATEATACLALPLPKGTQAGGDITGWQDAKKQTSLPLARCHLIAREFGGRGVLTNLVPCYQQGMNTTPGSMRTYELIIGRVLARLPAGGAVYLVVTPLYEDGTSTIPRGVIMHAVVQMPDGSSWPVSYPAPILNTPAGGGPNLGN